MIRYLAAIAVLTPVFAAALLAVVAKARALPAINAVCAVAVTAAPVALAIYVLSNPTESVVGSWYVVDQSGAVFLLVAAMIGMLSALASPSYLAVAKRGFFAKHRAAATYYIALYLFWALLLALPLVNNLAVGWLLIEATTAASAILVSFSGSRSALEAGWKYLVLTTLGLAVALFGIVVLYASLSGEAGSLATLDWNQIRQHSVGMDTGMGFFALLLILVGMAAKIGWAPVHNWLPDAHSQAPPPVSAMLSAALLPMVMLIAWRLELALRPALGDSATSIFVGFGLFSLVVAVPFLWRAQPLKRLLAYSSLEHMGILAIGIGFANPYATAGVLLHVSGHALAKSLGFYATIPMLQNDPSLEEKPIRALSTRDPSVATAVGISLGSLSGLPPSPLFFSEVLILFGGFAAGRPIEAMLAGLLLALGFLGLAHTAIEGIAGEPVDDTPKRPVRNRRLGALTLGISLAMLSLSVLAFTLPGSALVHGILGELS